MTGMEDTITFAWWQIPTIITAVGVTWALYIHDDGSRGYLSKLSNVFILIPVLAISCAAWIVASVFK